MSTDLKDIFGVDSELKTAKPKKFVVILINDDFTPMDFVIEVLQRHFRKSLDEANVIMMEVHKAGKAVAGGPYSLEVAETKVYTVLNDAKAAQHPLQAGIMEA